jgi:hypothetical protein
MLLNQTCIQKRVWSTVTWSPLTSHSSRIVRIQFNGSRSSSFESLRYWIALISKQIYLYSFTRSALTLRHRLPSKPRMTHMPIPFKSKSHIYEWLQERGDHDGLLPCHGPLTDSVYAWSMRLGLFSAHPFLSERTLALPKDFVGCSK